MKIKEIEKRLNHQFTQNELEVDNKYPTKVSEYYLSLIDKKNINSDPIALQCLPNEKENESSNLDFDPLIENKLSPLPKLIHKYQDRVVLIATNRCPVHCRFCFRKRNWNDENGFEISDQELKDVISYLKSDKKIKEVLISGGDPLSLSNKKLKNILDAVSAVENIDIIRIGTRIPVTLPSRVDKELSEILASYAGLWIMTHFNNPKEITNKSLNACNLLIKQGIPILNQTVLLKGVNDNKDILESLFRKLIKNRIKPHYLFHVDPVKSVTHFTTGIQCGLDILCEFRKSLSSIAVPTFAIDLQDGGGKTALQPNYLIENSFKGINDKLIKYYK